MWRLGEQAFVGRSPLKTTAWEAMSAEALVHCRFNLIRQIKGRIKIKA